MAIDWPAWSVTLLGFTEYLGELDRKVKSTVTVSGLVMHTVLEYDWLRRTSRNVIDLGSISSIFEL